MPLLRLTHAHFKTSISPQGFRVFRLAPSDEAYTLAINKYSRGSSTNNLSNCASPQQKVIPRYFTYYAEEKTEQGVVHYTKVIPWDEFEVRGRPKEIDLSFS